MNFPDTPFFQILYAIINTPGIGGIIVITLGLSMSTAVFLTLRWIARGSQAEESEIYAYPTTALHDHE